MGQTLNITAHEDPAAKIQQNYCDPWTMLKIIRFYVSPKVHYVEWEGICNLLYVKTYILFWSSAHSCIRTCRIAHIHLSGKANPLKRESNSFTPVLTVHEVFNFSFFLLSQPMTGRVKPLVGELIVEIPTWYFRNFKSAKGARVLSAWLIVNCRI